MKTARGRIDCASTAFAGPRLADRANPPTPAGGGFVPDASEVATMPSVAGERGAQAAWSRAASTAGARS